MAQGRPPHAEYNLPMQTGSTPDVEALPADLERFLGSFFDRRGWHAEIKFDPFADLLFLDVRLHAGGPADDDRFFSLVEAFTRAHAEALRGAGGLSLRCRLFDADGEDLTSLLRRRGARYLDDARQGRTMRRRLMWLAFRRRFVRVVLPGAALWAAAFVLVCGVLGVPLATAGGLAVGAVVLQALLARLTDAGRR